MGEEKRPEVQRLRAARVRAAAWHTLWEKDWVVVNEALALLEAEVEGEEDPDAEEQDPAWEARLQAIRAVRHKVHAKLER